MSLLVSACPRLIGLLQEFYPGDPGLAPFEMMTVTADLMPQPERSLLVHDRDMTSTLTRYHDDAFRFDVLDLPEPVWLYGRCNCFSAPEGGNIAEVVEILPPAHSSTIPSGKACKTTKQS